MKNLIQPTMFSCIILFFMSCAASHNYISPERFQYINTVTEGGVEFSYKYDILREVRNHKNAKKADKRNIKLAAVKITNHTDSSIWVNKDFNFYSANSEILLLQPHVIKSNLSQNAPVYALYGLLSFVQLNITTSNSFTSFPIGLLIGPPLALFNIVRAASANNKLLKELNHYNIINKEIKSKETVHGLIGFTMHDYNPLSIRLKN